MEVELEQYMAALDGPSPLLSLRAAVASDLAYGADRELIYSALDWLSKSLRGEGRAFSAATVDEVLGLMEGWGPEDLLLDSVERVAL